MKRFLIAGCQRSGTTLMRLLLESHPEIRCVDEILSYSILARGTPSESGGLIGYKIPVWTEQLDKPMLRPNELASISQLGPIGNFYSGEKIIFMLRSPLDVVSSMMRLKVIGRGWLESVCLPVMESEMNDQTFRAEYANDLNVLRASPTVLPGIGALYWKWKTSALLRYVKLTLPVHPVIYEQLVTEPEASLREILGFLGIEWQTSVLQHHQQRHNQMIAGRAIGGTDAARAVDAYSIGRWKSELSPEEAQLVRVIASSIVPDITAIAAGTKCWGDLAAAA